MMPEPSVLDYLKSRLSFWKKAPDPGALAVLSVEELEPDGTDHQEADQISLTDQEPISPDARGMEASRKLSPAIVLPWKSLVALGLAFLAQASLEPGSDRTWTTGVILYLLSAAWLVWANLRQEWKLAEIPPDERYPDPNTYHLKTLGVGAIFALFAYFSFRDNLFTSTNLILWLVSLGLFIRAFWLPTPGKASLYTRFTAFITRPAWNIRITSWTILLVMVAGLAILFRMSQLSQVPPEMNSDHAEKLLDVYDVLNGQTRIFFPRNTGREPLQFYLTAAITSLLGTGVSFVNLKLGTILAGLFTLPFIYLLGKEIANREVGLWATAFTAVAYWPNVIARVALRFALYPALAAPTLYFLIRGLRTSNRNDFILAGLFLGIGLHGYTPMRIVPFVVVAAVLLYLLHRQSQGVRKETLLRLGILAVIALVVFLPLLRFWQSNPELFAYRAFTRMSDWEQPLQGSIGTIFLKNTWNALLMMNWANGDVWTISIPNRPALDVIAGALFFLGVVLVTIRYLRKWHWLDLFLLVSIPLLMMPSILSLAFPNENPVLSRTGAAYISVFLLVGLAVEGLRNAMQRGIPNQWGKGLAWALGFVLLTISAFQNYDLVFNQYFKQYQQSAWNTSEMGNVIRMYSASLGSNETAWVVGYPHWVDTRLVGIQSGDPTRDAVILQDQIAGTLSDPRPKLFLVKPEDQASLTLLRQLYPNGNLQLFDSKVETKDFYMFFVPPRGVD